MAKHPISSFYKLIGNDYDTWIELINLFRSTAKEHERTLPSGNIFSTARDFEAKEADGCLCVWYSLDANLQMKYAVVIQRMLHLSTVLPGLAPIWSMSFGFDDKLIPAQATNPDYVRFIQDVFEQCKGRMGPKQLSAPGGSFGYFCKSVAGVSAINSECNLQIVGLNPPDANPPQRKIAKIEQAARALYPSAAAGGQWWKIDRLLSSYSHPRDFWGGYGVTCNIHTLTLLEQNPPGP